MSEIIETVAGYLADLGLDAGKDLLSEKYDEKKLRDSLISYIEGQKKYNEVCSLTEEIDFQGLIMYIRDNFLDDVKKRILCVKTEERRAARQTIVAAAVAFSKAETCESRIRVGRTISVCLDIIKDFYKKKIDAPSYILASEISDAVNEKIENVSEKEVNTLSNIIEKRTNDILSTVSEASLYSLDKLIVEANKGNYEFANELFMRTDIIL